MRRPYFGMSLVAIAVLSGRAPAPAAQTAAPPSLPYAAVHDPEFISAAAAGFMSDEDRVIGVITGKTAKAFPAGILSQHGLVEDRSPTGQIAITW